MKFFKTLFFISLLSIFLSGCQLLGIRKKTSTEIAQEKFIELENQYKDLLSFRIELQNLEELQKKYGLLLTESENILLSDSSEIKLSRKERLSLLKLNRQIARRSGILEDLKD
ncbi:MAG: hypothetical protein ACRDB2_01920 [Fusobacteriaceae bacterium]